MSRPDEIAVERLMAGRMRRSDARGADVIEAVRRMRADGVSATQIGRRLRAGGGAVARMIREIEETRRG